MRKQVRAYHKKPTDVNIGGFFTHSLRNYACGGCGWFCGAGWFFCA